MTTPGNAVCFPSSFPHSLWLTRCLQFGAFSLQFFHAIHSVAANAHAKNEEEQNSFCSSSIHAREETKFRLFKAMSPWIMRWNLTHEIYLQKNLPKTLFFLCCCCWFHVVSLVFGWKRLPGAIFVYEIFGFAVSVFSVTMILNICTFLVFDFLLRNSHTSLLHAPLHARTVYTIKHIVCVCAVYSRLSDVSASDS